jgi:hypothetical protein
MRRDRRFVAALVAAFAYGPAPAHAEDPRPRFAIGGESTLGLNGSGLSAFTIGAAFAWRARPSAELGVELGLHVAYIHENITFAGNDLVFQGVRVAAICDLTHDFTAIVRMFGGLGLGADLGLAREVTIIPGVISAGQDNGGPLGLARIGIRLLPVQHLLLEASVGVSAAYHFPRSAAVSANPSVTGTNAQNWLIAGVPEIGAGYTW